MFKKKPNIKSLAPLRSSDRRKVVDQIIRDYAIAVPAAEPSDTAQDDNTSNAAGITAVRNALLPEGAQSARFTTTVGADAKTASGTVYAGQHAGDELRILWIRLEDRVVPTVYTLWRNPNLVPLLFTPDIVLQKMRGGADLMTPGLARGPPFPEGAKKGAVVAVAAYENPSVPVVVGECAIDISSLKEVRGQKGNAVHGLHWEGDEIWAWGGGKAAPETLEGWDGGGSDAAPDVAALSLQEEETPKTNGDHKDKEAVAETVERPARSWTTKEIDDAFRSAFLYALHDARQKHRNEPGHGYSFPLQQSQFMAKMILPFLPIFTGEDAAALQIKKTSWKSIQKFIKALDKDVLLKSKVRNGGETVVQDADFDDRRVQDFEPYRLPKKGTSSTATDTPAASTAGAADPAVGQKLQIVSLLKPKASLQRVFTVAQSDVHALYLPTEIKMVVNRYLEAENLIRPADRGTVSIDPVLVDALYAAGSADPEARQVLANGYAPRDALLARAISTACSPFHLVHRTPPGGAADQQPDRSAATAGAPPKVRVTLETRSGNKTATRVSGLEAFGVGAAALADELQKVCAGATSVGQLAGSSPKKPVMEVMVQGPQRDAVLKQLERRGVKPSWVEVVDKTKKKR